MMSEGSIQIDGRRFTCHDFYMGCTLRILYTLPYILGDLDLVRG